MKKYIGIFLLVIAFVAFGNDFNFEKRKVDLELIEAVKNEKVELIKKLLKSGANPNAINTENNILTPLVYAVDRGNEKIINLLLENGADINLIKNRYYPLQLAIQKRDEEIVRLLIDNKADVNLIDKDGYTPLMEISSREEININIAKLLLENGAKVDFQNIEGQTPLALACYSGNEDLIKCLIEKGADVNLADKNGLTPLIILIWKESTEGKNELLAAKVKLDIEKNHELIKFLLENDADPFLKDKNELSSFDYAESEEVIKILRNRE